MCGEVCVALPSRPLTQPAARFPWTRRDLAEVKEWPPPVRRTPLQVRQEFNTPEGAALARKNSIMMAERRAQAWGTRLRGKGARLRGSPPVLLLPKAPRGVERGISRHLGRSRGSSLRISDAGEARARRVEGG